MEVNSTMYAKARMETGHGEYSDRAGLAASALPDRALGLLKDPDRLTRLASHRRWITATIFAGAVLLAGSLGALKFELAQSLQAERFAALAAVFGLMLLSAGFLLAWHSSATEQHLHRLAMLRLNLDSVEATSEVMRYRARIARAAMECERLPEPRRGTFAVEVLSVLNVHEENAQGMLVDTGQLRQFSERLASIGAREEFVEQFAAGRELTPQEQSLIDRIHHDLRAA